MTDQLRDDIQRSLGASYSLERELGGGGMSRVFVAEAARLHRNSLLEATPPERRMLPRFARINYDLARGETAAARRGIAALRTMDFPGDSTGLGELRDRRSVLVET